MQTYEDDKLKSTDMGKMDELFNKAEELQKESLKPLHHVIGKIPKKDSVIKVYGLEYKIVNSNSNRGMFVAKILKPQKALEGKMGTKLVEGCIDLVGNTGMKKIRELKTIIKQLEEKYNSFHKAAEIAIGDRDKQIIQIQQLRDDIEEYENVIDSLKQKLDATECLYEDSEAKIKQLEDVLDDIFIKAEARKVKGFQYYDFAKLIIDSIPIDLLSKELQKALEEKDG